MKKILFVTPYPFNKAPSQRLKFEQYYAAIEANGFEISKNAFVSDKFWDIIYKKGFWGKKILFTLQGYWSRLVCLFRLRRYDVVYMHLWVTPFGFPFFEWLYTKLSRKVIYDIDDLVYLPGIKSDMNPLITSLKGRNKPLFLMRHADHVITCTPYLDSIVRKYNVQTTDISSTINTSLYHPRQDYSIDKELVVLGWSGSVSTTKHLRVLEPVLRKLKEQGLKFKLKVMGDESFQIEGIDVEAIPWKESYEVDVISGFDIGLYPLPDEQWVYGKSGLKALQYMAAGVPTVATAIGTNFRIIENGYNGFLVKTDDEWIDCLKKLINDKELRERVGKNGARVVEQRFSINANKNTYLNIIREVISS
jgi:glycosyltransferase involved in cell wall biosynthesis